MLTLKRAHCFPYRDYPSEMSEELSIFQSAEIERCFFANSLMYAVPKRMWPCTMSVLDDSDPVLIVPALVSSTNAELAGHANGMCELSPIYFKGTEGDLKRYLKFFFDASGYREYLFTRIRGSTRLSRTLIEGIEGYDISATSKENVSIDFSNGYDVWFQSLSKNVRQNLRTAYNRLRKDGKDIHIEVSRGGRISRSLMNRSIDIYIKRHDERYNVKTSALKSAYLRYFDFSTRALMKNPLSLHIYIYISGRIAGFCSGYMDRDSFTVPRLSIDNDFSRYSPGYLLINETIKWFGVNDRSIRFVDLSEGTEKYKLDLGGTVYKKIDYTIKRIER